MPFRLPNGWCGNNSSNLISACTTTFGPGDEHGLNCHIFFYFGTMPIFKNSLPYLLISLFIVFKIQDLSLPYYWDEAWSYIPAIKAMAARGPSLMPNSIDPGLYRGHPLLFYFLSSVWMNIAGNSIAAARLFPLGISLLLLHCFYSFAKKHFGYHTALFSLVVFLIQSVFLVQSSFFLPEILLALFTVLSVDSFLDKSYPHTVLWLTAALYTKESGLVIWAVLFTWRLLEMVMEKEKNTRFIIKNMTILSLPLIFVMLFLVLQKITVGWFFFPEHISFFSPDGLFIRLNGYASYLFIYMGRNLLTFSGMIALFILIFKKDKNLFENRQKILLLVFFVTAYLLFSSLNFYSPRYMLSVLPFTLLIWVHSLIRFARRIPRVISVIGACVILGNNIYFTLYNRDSSDHSLGFRDMISVQSDLISYCENIPIYDREIQTGFLMAHYLTNPQLGYLHDEKKIFQVQNTITDTTGYVIFCSNELDKTLYREIRGKYPLVKRFEKKKAWAELYKIER
jgi:4-amino-4-deoxy-L-arabinose transferase-like glycosyltransferase